MKRGLKGEPHAHGRRGAEVAEYSPMKRGLKAALGFGIGSQHGSCRVFPDEEGTERLHTDPRPERDTSLQSIPR